MFWGRRWVSARQHSGTDRIVDQVLPCAVTLPTRHLSNRRRDLIVTDDRCPAIAEQGDVALIDHVLRDQAGLAGHFQHLGPRGTYGLSSLHRSSKSEKPCIPFVQRDKRFYIAFVECRFHGSVKIARCHVRDHSQAATAAARVPSERPVASAQ